MPSNPKKTTEDSKAPEKELAPESIGPDFTNPPEVPAGPNSGEMQEKQADVNRLKDREVVEASIGLTHEQALKNMEETEARNPAQPPTDGLTADEANSRRGTAEHVAHPIIEVPDHLREGRSPEELVQAQNEARAKQVDAAKASAKSVSKESKPNTLGQTTAR
jgi:hypothetical protein